MRSVFLLAMAMKAKTKKLIIRRDVVFYKSNYWYWDESSMNKKVKNTSQGVNLDPLSSRDPSSHDDSPPP